MYVARTYVGFCPSTLLIWTEVLTNLSSIDNVPIPVAARSKAWVCGRSLAGIVGSNIPLGTWMSGTCERCVLSGRRLCDGLVTRPGESYRVWCVWVWSWILDNEEVFAHYGCCAMGGGGGRSCTTHLLLIPTFLTPPFAPTSYFHWRLEINSQHLVREV
jgi:hypothetical protein